MDARSRAMTSGRMYEDFDPQTDWVLEDTVNTYLIYLPEFKKEHLRVQLTPARVLKISGERPLGDNKWKRFVKEIRIGADCNTKEISAKFEGGILYVRQPKTIQPHPPTDEAKPSSTEAKTSQQRSKPVPSSEPAKPPTTQKAEAEHASKANEPETSKPSKMKQNEGEAGKKESEKTTIDDDKAKKRDADSETVTGVGRDMFMALKRPENLKKVVGTVLVAVALTLHIAYVKRICSRDEL